MYESFFKLKRAPFQLTPNPLFFFDSDTHRQGLIKLRQAIRNGNAITAVAGEPGTGKTELMRRFISELDDKNTVIANIPLTSLRSSNILDYIASAFGVINMGFVGDALWSSSSLVGKIQQEVCSQTAEGKKFLVFIDNAESLSKSCMKKLLRLCSVKSSGMPLIQCFLFGESAVSHQVNLRGSSNSFFSIIKIESLEAGETRRYIEHRLLEAGWQGDPEFTETAFTYIHQISDGVPWHINLLCHRLLLQGFLQDTHVIDEQLVQMFTDVEQLETRNMEQLDTHAQQEVAGSDVAVASAVATKIVNLTGKHTGREAKGTSFSSSSANNLKKAQQYKQQQTKDSISYFFDDPLTVNDAMDIDEQPISVEDVEKAFAESMGDGFTDRPLVEENLKSESSDELVFPELNDSVELDAAETKQRARSIQDTVANVTADQNKMTASILERIFPDTVAMMEEYAQASSPRSGPVIDTPAVSSEDLPVSEDDLQYDDEALEESYPEQPSQKSSAQIAARASIVTSLAITLVMWVISDSRSPDEKVMQAGKVDRQDINTVTPSPFQNPDDLPRSNVLRDR